MFPLLLSISTLSTVDLGLTFWYIPVTMMPFAEPLELKIGWVVHICLCSLFDIKIEFWIFLHQIWGLGYEVSLNWQTYMVAGQTAGFLTKWKNTKMAFLTVHGAGHEVPTYKPEVALDLYVKFLAGEFTA